MIRINNDYIDKILYIDKIKSDAIHIRYVDDRSVTCWIKLSDNIVLHDRHGREISWSDLNPENCYSIIFHVPARKSFREKPTILATVHTVYVKC